MSLRYTFTDVLYFSYTLRLTFLSPSSLTAHLPQATLVISSIPQLCQLLSDEIERCLLSKICELGSNLGNQANRTWFVDLVTSRSVGRWEGYVMYVFQPYLLRLLTDIPPETSAFSLGRTTPFIALLRVWTVNSTCK